MPYRLVVVQGHAVGTQLMVTGQQTIEIGRSPAADLTLFDPNVADIHLKLFREGNSYTCFDVTGQGFGHNGRRTLKAGIKPGDTLQVGSHAIRLLSDAPQAQQPPAPPPPAPPQVASDVPRLRVVQGNDAGKSFPLNQKNVMILGRGVSTDVTIWDIRASRTHCRIDRHANGFRISDLGSSNGTYVNGQRIKTHELANGDVVKIGATLLQFQHA